MTIVEKENQWKKWHKEINNINTKKIHPANQSIILTKKSFWHHVNGTLMQAGVASDENRSNKLEHNIKNQYQYSVFCVEL